MSLGYYKAFSYLCAINLDYKNISYEQVPRI